ncbi:MAG: DUF6029 family protein [Cytophagales bacterium]
MIRRLLLLSCLGLGTFNLSAQNNTSGGFNAGSITGGQLHGDFLLDAQYYVKDEAINAQELPQGAGMNAYGNFNYSAGNFKAGMRLESYEPALLGFDRRYDQTGVTFRYAQYFNDQLDITVGNFYEQFGNGLTLRAYWEWYLGLDNNIDGIRVHYKPIPGIILKGIIGRQRFYFDQSPGVVRGLDGEFSINDIFTSLNAAKTRLIIGGSLVSRYQEDRNSTLILPQNVANFAGRINLSRGGFNLNAEYAYKVNDPSTINQNSYNEGDALLVNASFTGNNFGASIGMKRWDNMDFRSDRAATGFDLFINYQPALTRQHTYRLSSLYSYPTVPQGEMAFQADIFYNIKRGTLLGGKYGTNIAINTSFVNDISRTPSGDSIRNEYQSNFFEIGDDVFYRDVNVEITKKVSKKMKFTASVIRQIVNYVFQPATLTGDAIKVKSWIGIVEGTYSYKVNNKRYTSRLELQHLSTKQDFGDWFTGLFEQTLTSHWFINALGEYNYGNPNAERRNLYLSGAVGYRKDTYSIKVGGGRQRGGFLCVGGICRPVPENTGVTLTLASSF